MSVVKESTISTVKTSTVLETKKEYNNNVHPSSKPSNGVISKVSRKLEFLVSQTLSQKSLPALYNRDVYALKFLVLTR